MDLETRKKHKSEIEEMREAERMRNIGRGLLHNLLANMSHTEYVFFLNTSQYTYQIFKII